MIAISPYKLMHWLNARKVTPELLEQRTGMSLGNIQKQVIMDGERAECLAEALNIQISQIQAEPARPDIIYRYCSELLATCRPIQRGGIHFYNYYTLPAPKSHVAPVILDILCPSDRLPQLNRGHLEPAITVNLGPGPIHARWGKELGELTWQVLHANTNSADAWIVGDSYLEPPYCPHSYSLAETLPARIVSYTCGSNLEALLHRVDTWSPGAYANFANAFSRNTGATLLAWHLRRRGHNAMTLAQFGHFDPHSVDAYLRGDAQALSESDLRAIGLLLGVDHRLLLPPATTYDGVGKVCCRVADSRASIRRFESYTVASLAGGPHLTDLSGLFITVDDAVFPESQPLDLADPGSTHYLVTAGAPILLWDNNRGGRNSATMSTFDSVWIAPFVSHAFSGRGALLKLGGSEEFNYLDQLELTNTFAVDRVVARAHHDRQGWGYDDKSVRVP